VRTLNEIEFHSLMQFKSNEGCALVVVTYDDNTIKESVVLGEALAVLYEKATFPDGSSGALRFEQRFIV